MYEENANRSLLAVLRDRAQAEFGITDAEPSAFAQFLVGACNMDADAAHAVSWGEPAELSNEIVNRLAEEFYLNPQLLSCLVRPVSTEVLQHTIVDVTTGQFDTDHCDRCEEFAARVELCSADDDHEELLGLCLELLDHLVFLPGEQEGDLEEELFEGANEEVIFGSPLLQNFARIFNFMDEAAQLRVFAYAYQELAGTTEGRAAAACSAYARLRSDYLSAPARQLFDLLSVAPSGSLSANEVIEALALPNVRAIGQLEKSVQSAVQKLAADGHQELACPLLVSHDKTPLLSLSEPAQAAWRALTRADEAAQTSSSS